MDNLFPLLLFVIFLLAPLIEQIRKRGQPPQQPPTKRPDLERPLPRPNAERTSAQTRESASVLVPDDLWQVLTGEKRIPPPAETAPQPQTSQPKRPWEVVYIPPEETEDEEAEIGVFGAEDVDWARMRGDSESWQTIRPAESLETEPVIVSLETNLPSAAARHTSFHRKIDREEAARLVAVKREPLMPRTRAEFQRAFIMQEIFGTPRGLD